MNNQWYYAINGLSYGPVDLNILRQLAVTGKLKPSDLVWTVGADNWKPAGEVQGLFQQEAAPPPLPTGYGTSPDEISRRVQSLIGKDYSELSPEEYEFMVANGYSYDVPMTFGEKIGAAMMIFFVVGSAIAIYKLGFFIFFVLLIPVLLLISVFICIYGLVSGENEDKPFYLIVLTASAAMLIAIFNSANSSVFRDD
ncbi:DUF4339 domain-containing protein [Gimesia sp.]|uniref:DUF4339 domain-containing protein n=1 Tax=Gimesia sp. TaxID=2024833 RepID=UPI0032EFC4DB